MQGIAELAKHTRPVGIPGTRRCVNAGWAHIEHSIPIRIAYPVDADRPGDACIVHRHVDAPAGVDGRGDPDLAAAQFISTIGDLTIVHGAPDQRVHAQNPAGEPPDALIYRGVTATCLPPVRLVPLAALARTAQIAGALDAAIAKTVDYANARQSFGRALGKFRALQQSLAIFAVEAAAVNRAAIGITPEYAQHPRTRRRLASRSEFGAERHWASRPGASVCARDAGHFGPVLTAPADPTETV